MSRPYKCCRVCGIPGATYFKPAGIPLRMLEEIHLTVEETEALRLKDLGGLQQAGGSPADEYFTPHFSTYPGEQGRK